MSDPRSTAAAYGIRIELADLGSWRPMLLIAEYDAGARTIRVNARALEQYRRARGPLGAGDVRAFIDRAVAHELYHHREAVGEIARLPTHVGREQAAEAYAREHAAGDARLEAFFGAQAPR